MNSTKGGSSKIKGIIIVQAGNAATVNGKLRKSVMSIENEVFKNETKAYKWFEMMNGIHRSKQ